MWIGHTSSRRGLAWTLPAPGCSLRAAHQAYVVPGCSLQEVWGVGPISSRCFLAGWPWQAPSLSELASWAAEWGVTCGQGTERASTGLAHGRGCELWCPAAHQMGVGVGRGGVLREESLTGGSGIWISACVTWASHLPSWILAWFQDKCMADFGAGHQDGALQLVEPHLETGRHGAGSEAGGSGNTKCLGQTMGTVCGGTGRGPVAPQLECAGLSGDLSTWLPSWPAP